VRTPATRSLEIISSRLGWSFLKMRPRMSFALVIFCITLPGGVCVQRNLYSRVGRRRRWALLHQHPFWIFNQRGPSAHRPTCGGLCEDPELSVRTVWFEMNWLEGLEKNTIYSYDPSRLCETILSIWFHFWEETVRQEGEADAPQSRGGLSVSEETDWRAYRSSFFWKIDGRFFQKQKER